MSELWFFAVTGLTAGGAYALTALGIVVTYRGSGVLNFAQGALGMAGAFGFFELHYQHGWPVLPALAIGLLIGAALGATVYGLVLRFMRDAGDLPRVIATLGVLLALEGGAQLRYGGKVTGVPPVFDGKSLHLWGASISRDTLVVLGCLAVLSIVIGLVFARTRTGIVTSALSENPRAASTLGISPHPSALATWTMGGALAALAGCLLLPLTGASPLGLTLLVTPAMAAGLLGGFRSIPLATLAGVAMGVVEALLIERSVSPGLVKTLPFVLIILALTLRGNRLPTRAEGQTRALPALGSGRPKLVLLAVGVVGGFALALNGTAEWTTALTNSCIAALIALAIVVVTGYAGQISLAPMALAGVASLAVAHLAQHWELPFLATLPIGVVVAAAVGVLIGAPAVRVRGVNLAIVTLGLAVGLEDAVLDSPSLTGGVTGIPVHPPTIFGLSVNPAAYPDRYACVVLICVMLAALAVGNVRRGRSGRRYVAMRANERGATALGISVPSAKLAAFALSAGLAGLAGVLQTYMYSTASFGGFTTDASITALAFCVFGGIATVSGGMVAGFMTAGGLATVFSANVLHLRAVDSWLPLITGLVVVDMMLRSPDGLVWQAVALKRLVTSRLTSAKRPAGGKDTSSRAQSTSSTGAEVIRDPDPILVAEGITVRFGGTVALDQASIQLTPGRVTGVIGPNGAGKSTLIDVLTGFCRPDSGTVVFSGRLAKLGDPVATARRGIGRTFQSLELFEDLSVRENLLIGIDDHRLRWHLTDIFGPGRQSLQLRVAPIVAELRLDDVLDARVADLPQGKRRLVALARMLASYPTVVCLDEPAAGLSGPERRRLASLIRPLAASHGMAVLLVEHNIDLIAETCDELIALQFGRTIAAGPTAQVLTDDQVVTAYLGPPTVALNAPIRAEPVR